MCTSPRHYSYLSWFSFNEAAGYSQGEFSVRTFVKSTAAVLGLAWLLVPLGILHIKTLDRFEKLYVGSSIFPPLMGYAWGYIQSRLLYVMAPPFLLLTGLALRTWSPSAQITFTLVTIAANIGWLFLSYSITL